MHETHQHAGWRQSEHCDWRTLSIGPGQASAVMNHLLVQHALSCAESQMLGRLRKVPAGSGLPRPPYSAHLRETAGYLAQCGFDAEVVAAGLLHDHIEDLAGWSKERIAAEFTPRVAELVDWVTQQDKSLPWHERNNLYAERLRKAPAEAAALSCADKLSNIRSLNFYLERGWPVAAILKGGFAPNHEKFKALLAIFRDRVPVYLFDQYQEEFERFSRIGC